MARILLVEDDETTSQLVAAQLRRANHKVRTVASGEGAIESAKGEDGPELAVLDIGLPDMDGRDLLVALRNLPGLSKLPGIFLTAHVDQDEIEAGRALGAQYLTKPFILNALLNAIDKCLPVVENEGTW